MAKSLLLLLCCAFFFQALRAQDQQTANEQLLAYTGIPKKLELRKANFGWADHPNYFTKKMDTDDDANKALYGKEVGAKEIVFDKAVPPPPSRSEERRVGKECQ